MEDPYTEYQMVKRTWIPQMHRRSLPQFFTEQYNTPGNFRLGKETRDDLEFLPQYDDRYATPMVEDNSQPESYIDPDDYMSFGDLTEMYPIIKYLNDRRLSPREIEKFLTPSNYNKLAQLLRQFEKSEEQNKDYLNELIKRNMMEEEGYQNDAAQEGTEILLTVQNITIEIFRFAHG